MSLVAPSLLAANFLRLEEACQMVNESLADWFHLDVMDGQFVPNISYGIPVIEHIRKIAKKTCDVHLMIQTPERMVAAFAKAGADQISVHLEASPNLHSTLQQIRGLGLKAGVAINPHTPVDLLRDVMEDLDYVCVMSVNPGFGGQSFIPHTLKKIRDLRRMIHDLALHVLIEVDGGITLANAGSVLHAGADVLVAGSTVFSDPNPKSVIEKLKYAG